MRDVLKRRWAHLLYLLTLVVCSTFVLAHLQPRLILDAGLTPSGGDMGAHVWGPRFLRDILLPSGQITGWTKDWYVGFPALFFYFPLPSLVIALLSYVIPYNIAFKMVVVSGLVALPPAVGFFGRKLSKSYLFAALMAVASVPFLFNTGWTIYGGNIASTLAGEFSFSISLALGFFFLGFLVEALDTGRHRGTAAIFLGATALCHILPTIFVAVMAIALVVIRPGVKRWLHALLIAVVGTCISAFWLFPFAARLRFTNDMGWEKIEKYLLPLFGWGQDTQEALNGIGQNYLHVGALRVMVVLALVGAVIGLVRRRRAVVVLVVTAFVCAMLFRFMPGPTVEDPYATGKLWNARMLPFWYLCLYLLAAWCIGELTRIVAGFVARSGPGEPDESRLAAVPASAHRMELLTKILPWPRGARISEAAEFAVADSEILLDEVKVRRVVPTITLPALVSILVIVIWLGTQLGHHVFQPSTWFTPTSATNFAPGWATWNFSGYETESGPGAKKRKAEYFDLIETMGKLGRDRGCGRALWEYEPELDSMGTPMALMLLPYWTKGCIGSQEGLYFESSATTPAHFMAAGSVSKRPSNPQRGLPYKPLDLANVGIPRMQMLGVRYYMAVSDEAKAQADSDSRLSKVAESHPHPVSYETGTKDVTWAIYEVHGSELVAPMSHFPVVVNHLAFTEKNWKALADRGWFDQPSRYATPLAESGPVAWPRVRAEGPKPGAVDPEEPARHAGADLPLPSVPVTDPPRVTNIVEEQQRITFDVDQVGKPVLVKSSYFPNWRAKGADGPYRVSPNLMVVVPTQRHVVMEWRKTPLDVTAHVVSLLALVCAVALNLRRGDMGHQQCWWDLLGGGRGSRSHRREELHAKVAATAQDNVADTPTGRVAAGQEKERSALPENEAKLDQPNQGAGDSSGD